MTSKKIEQKISTLEEEISDLKSREESLSNKLESLTEGIATNFDDSESRTKIRELKSDKDILFEVVSRKESQKKELEEKLAQTVDAEQATEQYQKLIALAEQAEELESEFRKKIEEINEFLEKELPELLKMKRQWKKTAEDFMRNADQHSPGFLEATRLSFARQNKRNELQAEQLLETLKSEGVNYDSAMRATILESRYYSIPLKPVKSFEGLAFSEAIQSMCNQRNIPEWIEE